VLVEPLRLPQGVLAELESRLLLFFTQSSRNSKSILKEQSQEAARAEGAVVDTLHGIKRLALDVREALETGRIDTFGELLHDSWLLKKRLSSGVSNSKIDTYYAEARRHGAIGGKITGAGGGGFFMLLAKRGAQAELTAALEALGLFRMDYRFEASGAQVLTNSGLEIGPQLTLADRAA
jgi:D-glycero-alpha-D-manno-heptose-7-phosphate kinase